MVASFWLRGAFQVSRHLYGSNPCRLFTHCARQRSLYLQSLSRPGQIIFRGCFHPGPSNIAREAFSVSSKVAAKEVTGKDMIMGLAGYIWPKGNKAIKQRVLIALTILVGAKVLNISVPFLFKHAVDQLNAMTGGNLDMSNPQHTLTTAIFALLVGYGLARMGAAALNELRNAVFAKVAQHSIRRIAQNVFKHLHNLDLSFHLNRQTGALSKAIDRGSRGIASVLSAIVFNIVPTIFEMSLVTAILAYSCGPQFSLVALGAVGSYTVFTLGVTKWRTKFRMDMNKA
jgi:ATP-binding cassette subfamily B (MDR/TAP) protein 7